MTREQQEQFYVTHVRQGELTRMFQSKRDTERERERERERKRE